MKKSLTQYSTLASIGLILLSFGIDNMLMRFLLAGEIPGTNLTLPPTFMLVLFALLALLPFVFFSLREHGAKLEKQIQLAKKRLPKRRYSSVS